MMEFLQQKQDFLQHKTCCTMNLPYSSTVLAFTSSYAFARCCRV